MVASVHCRLCIISWCSYQQSPTQQINLLNLPLYWLVYFYLLDIVQFSSTYGWFLSYRYQAYLHGSTCFKFWWNYVGITYPKKINVEIYNVSLCNTNRKQKASTIVSVIPIVLTFFYELQTVYQTPLIFTQNEGHTEFSQAAQT